MLSAPAGLDEPALLDAVTTHWGVVVDSAQYRPLGFGSHHWTIRDRAGTGWFLTVDDLEMKRRGDETTLDGGYERLARALATALALYEHGETFVVAPIPTAGGEPLAGVADRYAASFYPLITGQSYDWGDSPGPEHRQAVLDMLVRLHGAPAAVRRRAEVDDLAVRKRDTPDTGPYAQKVADLPPPARRHPDDDRGWQILQTTVAGIAA